MLDACKRMHYVNEALELYGEDEASKHLAGAVEEIMNNRDCAYHEPTCACQKLDGWEFASSVKLIERLKEHYYNITNATLGGADGPPPPEVTYFVKSEKYKLSGNYVVAVTDDVYLFIMRAPFQETIFVPISEEMGVGDFINVKL